MSNQLRADPVDVYPLRLFFEILDNKNKHFNNFCQNINFENTNFTVQICTFFKEMKSESFLKIKKISEHVHVLLTRT